MRRIVSAHWNLGILLLILVLAGILRLAKLDQIPPGLHVDEAANAWNAYTLLKTGMDQHGVRWPIFYYREFGQNPSAMMLYALLPFQAIGGLNVWTARLPSAVASAITVWLIYFVGARLFGRLTGLTAAAMLATNPWHLQMSRFDGVDPLLILGSLAVFLWANMPLDDDEDRRPRAWRAALAGAVAGISCYGNPAVRLFLPLFFIGAVLLTWKGWWKHLQTREGALAICALALAGAIIFGPLLWKHLTDPEIMKRAQSSGWIGRESGALGGKIEIALRRYPRHFGVDFLFTRGDTNLAHALPPGMGLFYWYEFPLMVLGVVALILRYRSSRAARLLLLWVVLYPVADLLDENLKMNSVRSLPGLCGLVLLVAVGAVTAGRWLWQRRQATAPICYAMAVFIAVLNVRFLGQFYGDDFYRQKYRVMEFGADLLEAARWLRPRFNEVDAVFVTAQAGHPYITTLVGLRYDPEQWFRDARQIVQGPLPGGIYRNEDVYVRYGKIHFLVHESTIDVLKELISNGRRDRVIFIVRPGELELDKVARPVYEVRAPDGQVVMRIFDVYL